MIISILATVAFAAGGPKFVPKQLVIEEFAACTIKNDPGRVRELLSTELGSSEERSVTKKVATMGECLPDRNLLSGQTYEFRAAITEAYLKYSQNHWNGLANLPKTQATPIVETDPNSARFTYAYSECLAFAEPAKVRDLFGTPHGSKEETAAVIAFGDTLKQCMPQNIAYRINSHAIRMMMALAIFPRVDEIARNGAVASNNSDVEAN